MTQFQVVQMPAWHVSEWLVIDMCNQTEFQMFDIEGEAKDYADLANDNTE